MKTAAQKPRRIMHVITRLILGGAQEVVALMVRRLVKEGYQVILVHGYGAKEVKELLPSNDPNLEIHYIPEFRRNIDPISDVIVFLKLWKLMKKTKPVLVHTHTSKAGILGRWAAKFAGVPILIHHPRGSLFHPSYYPAWFLQILALIERITARITDKMITVSESEKQDYVRYQIAPAEQYVTIYSGVEVARYTDVKVDIKAKKAELGIPEGRPVIGYIARIVPEKAHWLCLQAFSKVLEKIPNAFLVLIGSGPLENEAREIIRKSKLENNVIMKGMRRDIPEIIQTFDCCVQTSLWDGLPRAMIEAMLAEKPVVATHVGGIPEIVEHNQTGILVPEKDVEAIAQGVIRVLEDPGFGKRLGQNARRKLEGIIDSEISIRKILALYDELIQQKIRNE